MGKKGGNEAALARKDELARQKRIREGTRSINTTFDGQFNDQFYADQKNRYLNYANPQLLTQHQDAGKQLTYALARSGMLDSSARADLEGQLSKKYSLAQQQVKDQALAYGSQARNNVEDARANLISLLNATGDAQGAANSALARAQALSQPAAYSPLGQLFVDFTSTLGNQFAAQRAYEAMYGTGGGGGGGAGGALYDHRNAVKNS